jgi:polyisoprenoid-binding protein YceI
MMGIRSSTIVCRVIYGLIAITLCACKSEKKYVQTSAAKHITHHSTNKVVYADTTKSLLSFVGRKKIVGTEHEGFFKLKKGVIFLNEANDICGGELVWDIRSIKFTEADSITKMKLIAMLVSDKFFDVVKYPESVFHIDTAYRVNGAKESHMVSGNLQIGGTYRYISIPIQISVEDKSSTWVKGNFDIHRKDWNLFLSDKNSFQDNMIQDIVHIGIMANIKGELIN